MVELPLSPDISEVRLLPYCEVDGIRTFKDSEIEYLFTMIQKEGKVESLFYDGFIQDEAALLAFFKQDRLKLWIVIYKNKIRGLVWLTDFRQATACAHFVMFGTGASLLKIAQQATRQLIYMKDADSNYIFSVLTGFVSQKNTRAIEFLKRMGWDIVGVIPNAIYDYYDQIYYGGMLFSATRGE